ncbi:MAG TPA: CoB--CoM heterodisulfide reductase iron-sulfur subunit B family protein [Candidatus Humimicrobiaceae bacterium]
MDTRQKDNSAAEQDEQKFAYYPGCSLNSTSIDFNVSVKKLLKVLDIHFEEIEDWNCCGTTPAHNVSNEMSMELSARNLFLAKNMGLDEIIAPCVSCYCKLSKASNILNNEEAKSGSEAKTQKKIFEVFQDMGFKTEDEFNFKIYSIVELLYKNKELIKQKFIENKSKNSIKGGPLTIESEILSDLKPVCYYGCVLLRTKGVTQFDNMENPTSMEEILDDVGIKSRNFRFKTECCGAILSLTHKNIVLKLSKEILDATIEAGANSIVVCCPLCQQNLDLRQSQINKRYKTNYNIPVYYISQILGLALGLSYKDVMIDRLFVEPKFLKK